MAINARFITGGAPFPTVPGKGAGGPPLERRVRALLTAADTRGLGIAATELAALLPAGAPHSGPEVAQWLRSRPDLATISGERVLAPGREQEARTPEDDAARAGRYRARAAELFGSTLAGSRPWLESVAITGSTAYGRPAEGEDCDFFAVARDGALWIALLGIYLRLRLRRPASAPGDPSEWCFNYVVEAGRAREEFARRRGLLFAREALLAQPVLGPGYYRSLVDASPWIAEEAPRLYAEWAAASPGRPVPARGRTPVLARLANALAFLPVAAYLQAIGLVTNWRFARAGRSEERFRTITERRRLAIQSEKFERLVALFAPAGGDSRRA